MIINNSRTHTIEVLGALCSGFQHMQKGTGKGEHRLLCLEDVVVVCTCGNIFLVWGSI